MTRTALHSLAILALSLLLAGCGGDDRPLTIGSKEFGESEILAEMFAALAETRGIPVVRRIGLGDTQVNLEGLKRGDLDIYPEYNGTGLVMLGQPAMADGDAAMERLRPLYEPLGLLWGERLGFANDYGLVMRADRAKELGVSRISDLVPHAPQLRIGIDEDFAERPLDGVQPMANRYGLSFAGETVYVAADRPKLYDLLIDGGADVIEGFTTDGQIADYGLLVLEDDLDFFPVYEAVPLMRADALRRWPALEPALDGLAGKLDAATMRRLNMRVDIDGEAPRAVAQATLVEFGLLASETAADEAPDSLRIATPPLLSVEDRARALRAIRRVFAGRQVALTVFDDPLAAVDAGSARLAILPAPGFFALDEASTATLRPGFEAVGLLGESAVFLVAPAAGPASLADVTAIATGPDGSVSHGVGRMLVEGLNLDAELAPSRDSSAAALQETLSSGRADAVLALGAPEGAIAEQLAGPGSRVLSLEGWADGANLLRYPFLRQLRLAGGVETLSAQLVLAGPGPAPAEATTIGDQGPGAVFTARAQPLADETVRRLAEALGSRVQIDPILPQAPALAPALPEPPAAMSPAPDVSVLDAGIIALLIWLIWLYARPQRR
jgi:glycine betaine/choline ABC-type transport system substrate-binding protein